MTFAVEFDVLSHLPIYIFQALLDFVLFIGEFFAFRMCVLNEFISLFKMSLIIHSNNIQKKQNHKNALNKHKTEKQ